jgi:hypothetical protein
MVFSLVYAGMLLVLERKQLIKFLEFAAHAGFAPRLTRLTKGR